MLALTSEVCQLKPIRRRAAALPGKWLGDKWLPFLITNCVISDMAISKQHRAAQQLAYCLAPHTATEGHGNEPAKLHGDIQQLLEL